MASKGCQERLSPLHKSIVDAPAQQLGMGARIGKGTNARWAKMVGVALRFGGGTLVLFGQAVEGSKSLVMTAMHWSKV